MRSIFLSVARVFCVTCPLLLLGSVQGAVAQTTPTDTISADLTLDDAVRIALSESPTVQIGDLAVRKQQYSLQSAYGQLFPSISFSTKYSYTIKKQVMYLDGFPGASQMPKEMMEKGIEIGRTHNIQGGFSAGLPLVNLQLWESISLSKDAVELSLRKAQTSRIDKVCEVRKAFYTALLARDAYDVLKQSYENAQDNYKRISNLYAQGLVAKYDLIRGEVQIKNIEPSLLEAENNVVLTRKALLVMMGLDPSEYEEVKPMGKLTNYADEVAQTYLSGEQLSIEGNAQLRELETQRRMQERSLQLAKNAFVPTLSAGMVYNFNYTSNDFKLNNKRLWTPFSAVTVNFSFPLLQGGSRYFKIKQEKISLMQLDWSRKDAERQLDLGMQRYRNQLRTSSRSLAAADNAVKAAKQGYEIAQKRYETGQGTLLEVNDANVSLLQAQLNYDQAIFSMLQARAEMDKIAGKGLPDEADSNTNQQQ